MAWASKTGPAPADPGAALGEARTVSADAVRPGPADGPAGGYSVRETDDIDAAVNLVRDHPLIAPGGSLQISQAVAP